MQELFRFSVLRAADRANPQTVALSSTPKAPLETTFNHMAAPQPNFQDQLRQLIQSLTGDRVSAAVIWKRLEPLAVNYLLTQAPAILANALWTDLGAFLTGLQAAIDAYVPASDDAPAPPAGEGAAPVNPADAVNAAFTKYDGQDAGLARANYQSSLSDLFLAAMIVRRSGPAGIDALVRAGNVWTQIELLSGKPSLQEIADRIIAVDLLNSGTGAFAAPADAVTVQAAQTALKETFELARSRTLLLPPALFAPLAKPVHGVGFRELHVVKQHIRRYEMAEIGRLENILKGESRHHTQKHSLSNEKDTFLQTDTTTETDKELTSTDHTDIKNESEDQVKEDTKVDAGVHAQYDGGSFKLQADLTVSYAKSTDNTKKYASDVAKDVTQKAVSKVTQRVTQSQTTKIIETFEESEQQAFDNVKGNEHVSGVYQWLEKVYLAQVFNLGRHMLFDLMVPEPASALLALATSTSPDDKPPQPPYPLGTVITDLTGQPMLDANKNLQLNKPLDPLALSADAHDPNYYGTWLARYGATGVLPPPPDSTIISVSKDVPGEDNSEKHGNDVVRIDEGYGAFVARARASWKTNDDSEGGSGSAPDDSFVLITVGDTKILFSYAEATSLLTTGKGRLVSAAKTANLNAVDPSKPLDGGTISYSFITNLVNSMTFDLEITCARTDSNFAKWQLQAYEKIATAWQTLQNNYDTQMAARKIATKVKGPLGAADPEANRLTERIELKRSCIALIDNDDVTVRGAAPTNAVKTSPIPTPPDPATDPRLPEPDLDVAASAGARVRWFEQAFEWENMAYVFYPYFWGRRQTWIDRMTIKNIDPLFVNFLQAGYARVVVPVRLGFERAVHFYLHTGLPWMGGDIPSIGDKTQNPLYLDVAEEIKALTGGGETKETETPIGDPWEYTLPTTLMKLRKTDDLPEWHRVSPANAKIPIFASDQPDGDWTWRDGPPA